MRIFSDKHKFFDLPSTIKLALTLSQGLLDTLISLCYISHILLPNRLVVQQPVLGMN